VTWLHTAKQGTPPTQDINCIFGEFAEERRSSNAITKYVSAGKSFCATQVGNIFPSIAFFEKDSKGIS